MIRSIGSKIGPVLRSAGEGLESASHGLRNQIGSPFIRAQPAFIAFRPEVHEKSIAAALFKQELDDKESKGLVPMPTKFVAPTASVSPDAKTEEGSSVWYHSKVGAGVSLGENSAVMELASVQGDAKNPTFIGNSAFIAPGASVNAGANIGDRVVVNARAIVDGAVVVEEDAVIGQGAHVVSGTKIKSRELWAGSPAVFVRQVETSELAEYAKNCVETTRLAMVHQKENAKGVFELDAERQAWKDRTEWSEDVTEDHGHKWDTFAPVDLSPNDNPERRGLIYNK